MCVDRVRLHLPFSVVVGLSLVGCMHANVHANPDDWTPGRATAVITSVQSNGLQGYINEAIAYNRVRGASVEIPHISQVQCTEDHFTLFTTDFAEAPLLGPNLYKVQPRYTTVRFSEIAEVDVGFSPAWFILLCGFLPPWMSFGDAQIVLKSGEIVPIRYTIEFPGFYLFPLWLYPYHPIHGYSEYLHAIDYLRQRADSP